MEPDGDFDPLLLASDIFMSVSERGMLAAAGVAAGVVGGLLEQLLGRHYSGFNVVTQSYFYCRGLVVRC